MAKQQSSSPQSWLSSSERRDRLIHREMLVQLGRESNLRHQYRGRKPSSRQEMRETYNQMSEEDALDLLKREKPEMREEIESVEVPQP